MMKKYIVNISFLLVLFFFSINNYFGIITVDDPSENRQLAAKPELDLALLDPYPTAYNDYINDNFAGRNYLVRFYYWLSNNVFMKRSVKGKSLRGTDNYIFEMKKNFPVYTGTKTLTQDQIDRIIKEFNEREKYFSSKGIKTYVLVIPTKYKIYSDKLPMLIRRGKNNIGDLFIDALSNNTNINVINGEEVLLKYKKDQELYYKFDTHWNKMGAFYAFQSLLKNIEQDFDVQLVSDTSMLHIEEIEVEYGNMKGAALNKEENDIGYLINPKHKTFVRASSCEHKNEDFVYGQDTYCRRFISENKDFPKAVMFRDSYANLTQEFFPESFSDILYIWDEWKYMFNKDIVDAENPDIVIYAICETYIDRVLMEPSFVEADETEGELQ